MAETQTTVNPLPTREAFGSMDASQLAHAMIALMEVNGLSSEYMGAIATRQRELATGLRLEERQTSFSQARDAIASAINAGKIKPVLKEVTVTVFKEKPSTVTLHWNAEEQGLKDLVDLVTGKANKVGYCGAIHIYPSTKEVILGARPKDTENHTPVTDEYLHWGGKVFQLGDWTKVAQAMGLKVLNGTPVEDTINRAIREKRVEGYTIGPLGPDQAVER